MQVYCKIRNMKIIIGLGNPGKEYINQRHNVGFMFLDFLIKDLSVNFKYDKYLQAQICPIIIEKKTYLLIKPQTFMNLSGIAAQACLNRFKFNIDEELMLIHDDLDIPLGKFKIQKGLGPKLHNGVESIEKQLKTTKFFRTRIGIDNRQKTGFIDGKDYVLNNFTTDEVGILLSLFPQIKLQIQALF